jgi:hypothetical protein
MRAMFPINSNQVADKQCYVFKLRCLFVDEEGG